MSRKRRQTVAFPTSEPTNAELDALIEADAAADAPRDANEKEPSDSSVVRLKKTNRKKAEAAQVVKEVPQIFGPDDVIWIFDVYVGAVCFIFSLILKCDFKVLWEELALDDDVKQAWAKPLARIASKYAPSEWAGMTAEIQLVASVGIWTVAALPRAKRAAAEKAKQQRAEATRQAPPPPGQRAVAAVL